MGLYSAESTASRLCTHNYSPKYGKETGKMKNIWRRESRRSVCSWQILQFQKTGLKINKPFAFVTVASSAIPPARLWMASVACCLESSCCLLFYTYKKSTRQGSYCSYCRRLATHLPLPCSITAPPAIANPLLPPIAFRILFEPMRAPGLIFFRFGYLLLISYFKAASQTE